MNLFEDEEEIKNEDQRGFKGIWIPKEIYLDDRLSWIERICLVEINSLDNEKSKYGGCYASNAYLAKFLGISQDRISKIITKLKKFGLVKQISFNGRIRILKTALAFLPSQTRQKQLGSIGENAEESNKGSNKESLNITPAFSSTKSNTLKPKLQKIAGQSVLSFYKTNDITEKILLKLVDNPDQDIVNRLNNDLADNDILEELEILLKDVLATVRIMPANLRKKIEKLLIVVSAPKSILEKAIKVVASREKTNSISYLAGVVSRMQKKAIKA